jgi:hypothetical protein
MHDFGVEFDGRDDGQHDKDDGQHDHLADQKGRLGTRGRQRMQGRHIHKELRDQHEDVQVEGNRSGYSVYLAPRARQVLLSEMPFDDSSR